jgi:hypothetical protein
MFICLTRVTIVLLIISSISHSVLKICATIIQIVTRSSEVTFNIDSRDQLHTVWLNNFCDNTSSNLLSNTANVILISLNTLTFADSRSWIIFHCLAPCLIMLSQTFLLRMLLTIHRIMSQFYYNLSLQLNQLGFSSKDNRN